MVNRQLLNILRSCVITTNRTNSFLTKLALLNCEAYKLYVVAMGVKGRKFDAFPAFVKDA